MHATLGAAFAAGCIFDCDDDDFLAGGLDAVATIFAGAAVAGFDGGGGGGCGGFGGGGVGKPAALIASLVARRHASAAIAAAVSAVFTGFGGGTLTRTSTFDGMGIVVDLAF